MAFDPRVNPNLPSSVKIIDAPPGFSREELDHIIKQAFPVESTASTPSPPRNFDDFTSFSKIVDQTYTRLSETAMPELGGDSDDADDGFRTFLINGTLVFFVAIMFILPNGVVFLVRLREERRIPKLFRRRYLLSAALVWTAYFALFSSITPVFDDDFERSALSSLLAALLFEVCDFAQIKFLIDETKEEAQRTPRNERLLTRIHKYLNTILPFYAVVSLAHAFVPLPTARKPQNISPFVSFATPLKEGTHLVLSSTVVGVSSLLRLHANPARRECKALTWLAVSSVCLLGHSIAYCCHDIIKKGVLQDGFRRVIFEKVFMLLLIWTMVLVSGAYLGYMYWKEDERDRDSFPDHDDFQDDEDSVGDELDFLSD